MDCALSTRTATQTNTPHPSDTPCPVCPPCSPHSWSLALPGDLLVHEGRWASSLQTPPALSPHCPCSQLTLSTQWGDNLRLSLFPGLLPSRLVVLLWVFWSFQKGPPPLSSSSEPLSSGRIRKTRNFLVSIFFSTQNIIYLFLLSFPGTFFCYFFQ